MIHDTPIQVLQTLQGLLRLQSDGDSASYTPPILRGEPIVVSLVDLTLSRLESFDRNSLLSNAQTVKAILAKSHFALSAYFQPQPTLDSHPFLAAQVHDLTDRKDFLRKRIRRISNFFLDNLEGGRGVGSFSCSATEDVEAFVKSVVSTARTTVAMVKADPEYIRMDVSEQVITYLDAEFEKLRYHHRTNMDIPIHVSCESCFGLLRACSSQQTWMHFSECCIAIQTTILDTIEDVSLRDRRRAANKKVDEFLARIEAQREVVDFFIKDLERLALP